MKLIRIVATLACALCLSAVWAQDFPSKRITVIVPFPPGGSSDTTMRLMSNKLKDILGQPIIIDTRPGANGTMGAGMVARSAPDGYTLLIASIGTFAITPSLIATLPYDTRKDLEPLMLAVRTPNVMVVRNSLPVNSVAELVEYMKKNRGKVSFASSGAGSTDHLTAELFWQKTGTQGIHVPYKGGGQAINDIVAGHADVLITNLGVLTGHIKAGKMRALAVSSAKRTPELPQTPTFVEAGVKDLEVYSWQGIAGPKGMPKDVSAKLSSALTATLKDPEVRKSLEGIGFEVVGSTSEQFAQELQAETVRWKKVIDTAGIKPE